MFFFEKQKIKYLGHVVSERRVSTDKEKISFVRNWSVPRTKKCCVAPALGVRLPWRNN